MERNRQQTQSCGMWKSEAKRSALLPKISVGVVNALAFTSDTFTWEIILSQVVSPHFGFFLMTMTISSRAPDIWSCWLLGVLALNMIVLSACLMKLEYVMWGSQESLSIAVDLMLVVWTAALFIGGVCGLVAASYAKLLPARWMLACWILSSIAHACYLFVGQVSAVYSATSNGSISNWIMTLISVVTDMLVSILIVKLLKALKTRVKICWVQEPTELRPLLSINDKIVDVMV